MALKKPFAHYPKQPMLNAKTVRRKASHRPAQLSCLKFVWPNVDVRDSKPTQLWYMNWDMRFIKQLVKFDRAFTTELK